MPEALTGRGVWQEGRKAYAHLFRHILDLVVILERDEATRPLRALISPSIDGGSIQSELRCYVRCAPKSLDNIFRRIHHNERC